MSSNYKQTVFPLLLFVFLLKNALIYSQIIATPASGCSPLSVQLSGPSGATNVYWNLGSQGTTTLNNPNPLYSSPGSYPVTYTALVGGSPVSYSTIIVVGTPPTGSFSYTLPASHCAPMTVTFNAQGGSQGSTVSWAFGDLTPVGTGNNLTHTYQFANSFVPVAIIQDAVSGCTAAIQPSSGGTIHVSAQPTVNILSSNGLTGCVPPFTTNITGTTSVSGSPIGPGLNFSWQFNIGSPPGSAAPTPGNITFQQGAHTVQVTVTDNNQCSNTGSVIVSVFNPSLTAIMPATVCLGAKLSATVTSPQNACNIIGTSVPLNTLVPLVPGQTTLFDSLTSMYVPGLHQILFVVQAASGCPIYTATQNVFVEEIIPGFIGSTPLVSCGPTMQITYTNITTVNSGAPLTFSFEPEIPDPIPYNVIAPAIVLTSNTATPASFTLSQGSQNPYTLYGNFNPLIVLTVRSSNGCIARFSAALHTIYRPNARFSMSKKEGCAPLVVALRDTSWAHSQFAVNSWTWSNGTSPPTIVTGTQQVTYTYTSPGIYVPSLTITTNGGCSDVYVDTVYVGLPPTVSATFPATVCAGVPVQINMTGSSGLSPPGGISHWHFESDLGYFSGCITNQNPSFPFSHVGTHTVAVSGYERGCRTTSVIPGNIVVHGPYGKFRATTHCSGDKKIVDFDVHLQDATSATFNFGDNTPLINITGNPNGNFSAPFTHTYSASGNYTVTLTSFNNSGLCGPKTFTRSVNIRQPQAVIKFNNQPMVQGAAIACVRDSFNFNGISSTENSVTCSTGYKWWMNTPNFDIPPVNEPDGVFRFHMHNITDSVLMYKPWMDRFLAPGFYTINLEVKDINGCADTSKIVFRISDAVPVFTFAANPHCMSNGPLQIINTTQASMFPPDVITSYTWDYGDGGIDTSTNALYAPSHLYFMVPPPSQTFVVRAVAVNQLGCIDTTEHVVQINNPMTGFLSDKPYVCIKKGMSSNPVTFQAMQGYQSYSMSAGIPTNNPTWQNTSTFSNVTASYNIPATYFPTLTVTDAAGCRASTELTITALGQPTAHIANLGASGYCVPAKVKMRDSTAINISPISGYQWAIGNIASPISIGDSILENIFPNPGVFTVQLTSFVGDLHSCPSTASLIVHVFNTKGNLEIDKTIFCLGDQIHVKAKDLKDVYSWKWFFGDLIPQPIIYNTTFAPNPIAYNYTTFPPGDVYGKTIVSLVLYSDPGAGCVITKTVGVQVIRINSDFVEINGNYRHCLSAVPDNFVSTTQNPLNLNLINSWIFSAPTKTTGSPVSYVFENPGVFPVTLTVQDADYSCTSSAIKNMTILPLPKSSISISDSLVCPRDTLIVTLKGEPVVPGLLTGYFTPSSNSLIALPQSNSLSLSLTTTVTTKFSFEVVDTNGCVSPPAFVFINVPEPAPEIHTATTVVVGQTIGINAAANGNYSYTWRPETRFLNDSLISNPVSSTLVDIIYSVTVVDQPKQCWSTISTYSIHILPVTTIDVPTAFTPNGDGINDFIFPDGWGVRKLVYFRVYNRWGQLLFETNEFKKGWNGEFQGIPQNMETYVYQVEVETYVDKEPKITKSGTFKLIR